MLSKPPKHIALGVSGETQATHFLQLLGLHIIGHNVRVGKGELDIVAIDEKLGELVIVEVKTRSAAYFGDPSSAVDRRKLGILRRTAAAYVRQLKWRGTFRIDILAVLPGTIRHYQNVTW